MDLKISKFLVIVFIRIPFTKFVKSFTTNVHYVIYNFDATCKKVENFNSKGLEVVVFQLLLTNLKLPSRREGMQNA
jgi:hypothetical protein